MPISSENMVSHSPAPHLPADPGNPYRNQSALPVLVLGLMMFMVAAFGVPNVLTLQDTLKSAIVTFGVLIASVLFIWQQRQRSTPLLWHGLVVLPWVLMLYALFSMTWSHTYLAGVEAIRWFVLSLLVFLGLNTLTRENLPLLVWGIHLGIVVASIWAVLQFLLNFGLFPQAIHPASTFINRNFFAEYAVSALPFSVYVLFNLRPSRWLGVVALSVVLPVLAIMMTGTRSALVALLVLVPVITTALFKYRQQLAFLHWSRAQKSVVGWVLVAGVLGLGSLPSANPRVIQENTGTTALQRSFVRTASLSEAKEYTTGSFSVRAYIWKATARMMIAQPLSGVGAGAWEVVTPLYQNRSTFNETEFYAHNEFLQLLSEYGVVVGGLFVAVLLAYLLIAAGKTWRLQGAGSQEAPLRAFTLASLLALLIVSNAGFPWHMAATGALLALCLALLAASDARLGLRDSFYAAPLRWQPWCSCIMLAVLVCSTGLALTITVRAIEAERKIMTAILLGNTPVSTPASGSLLQTDNHQQLLKNIREGVAINPHYRKLSATVADQLVARSDWENAAWLLESLAASRPHLANLWANIILARTQIGQSDRALMALQQLQRLQPDTPRTRALEVMVLSRSGQQTQAAQMLLDYFAQGRHEFDLMEMGYTLGVETHNWPLAIRSLELRIQHAPAQSALSYLRLGKIYSAPELHDETKALVAFSAGLRAAPQEQQDDYRKQVPEKYQARL